MNPKPEHWLTDAADAAQARLEVPADSLREREFEVSVTMTVRSPAAGVGWHALHVEADGQLQWQRRSATHNPGSFDGLEVRFRRRVPVGRPLRLLARADCGDGTRRLRLQVEAEEC